MNSSLSRLKASLLCLCGLVATLVLIAVGFYWKADMPTIGELVRWRLQPGVEVNCRLLFEGNEKEISKVKSNMRLTLIRDSDKVLLRETKNCTWVKEYFDNGFYLTEVEQRNPIGFSFLVHNGAEQVIRLLKLLYRPHNQYIIAPDLKSRHTYISIYRNIAACMDNIHIVSKLKKVKWGHRSIMETQMQMYMDLMEMHKIQEDHRKWKYIINLCGKELPLKSNYEIVSRLVKLNRTSMIQTRKVPPDEGGTMVRLNGQTVPFSLSLYKSMTYMALSFEFINFLFTNSTAVHLFNFFKTCDVPEEHFYATVYRIPNVPGGCNPEILKHFSFDVDNYFWRTRSYVKEHGRQCSGSIVHHICVVNVGDLNRTLEAGKGKGALFHNKYFMEYDHVVMDCMEEKMLAINQLEHSRTKHLGP